MSSTTDWLWEYFYDKTKIKEINGQYVIDSEEKARLEEKQNELLE